MLFLKVVTFITNHPFFFVSDHIYKFLGVVRRIWFTVNTFVGVF